MHWRINLFLDRISREKSPKGAPLANLRLYKINDISALRYELGILEGGKNDLRTPFLEGCGLIRIKT